MTLRFNSNIASTGSVDTIFKFKEFMKTASPSGPGWTVKMSGQGTSGTYSSSGDVLTSTGDFLDYYWFVLQDPAGGREILIQGNSTGSFVGLYVMYSKGAGFSGGYANERAVATDEVCVWGYYDNAVFGNYKSASFFNLAYFPGYLHMWGDDSNEYSFGFYNRMQTQVGATTSNNGFLVMEECLNSYSSDVDNVAFMRLKYYDALNDTNLNRTSNFTNNSGIRTFVLDKYNQYSFENINPLNIYIYSSTKICPLGMGTDVITGSDYVFPIILANSNLSSYISPYYKGFLKNIMWQGANRAKASTLTINTTNDYLVVDDLVIPWDGSTPTI
jgi:hypothetical protein